MAQFVAVCANTSKKTPFMAKTFFKIFQDVNEFTGATYDSINKYILTEKLELLITSQTEKYVIKTLL